MSSILKDKVIVVTRSSDQAKESIKKFESLGATVIPLPTIKIKPLEVFNMFDNYANKLYKFDYIVFTSENAVTYSLERLKEINISIPESVNVICVGKKTAEKCNEFGIEVDIVPDNYSATGLLDHFRNKKIEGKKFFIPSSAIAKGDLKYGLILKNAEVEQVPIYEIGLPDKEDVKPGLDLLKEHKADIFVFTSPSTFKNTIKILGIDNPKKYFGNFVIAVIGTTTASALDEANVRVDVIPKNFTMDDLVDAIIDFYSKKKTTNS